MKFKTFVLVLIINSFVTACTSRNVYHRAGASEITLSSEATFYVAAPRDFRRIEGSGLAVYDAVLGSFDENARVVGDREQNLSLKQVFSSARDLGAEYVVVPVILYWEDPAVFAIRRKAGAISLTIMESESEELVTAVNVAAKEGPSSTITDPVLIVLNNYIASLF